MVQAKRKTPKSKRATTKRAAPKRKRAPTKRAPATKRRDATAPAGLPLARIFAQEPCVQGMMQALAILRRHRLLTGATEAFWTAAQLAGGAYDTHDNRWVEFKRTYGDAVSIRLDRPRVLGNLAATNENFRHYLDGALPTAARPTFVAKAAEALTPVVKDIATRESKRLKRDLKAQIQASRRSIQDYERRIAGSQQRLDEMKGQRAEVDIQRYVRDRGVWGVSQDGPVQKRIGEQLIRTLAG